MNSGGTSRFIFVGGAPRSGTTLVQNMLDSHPDILGGPEFIHIPDIINLRQKLHHSISIEWIDLICSYDDVDNCIGSLIEDLLLPFADKYGGKLLSEKTPANVLVFSELISLFPKARFIHVVRDPRAIVASMLQAGARAKEKGIKTAGFTSSLNAAINYTKRCLKSGFGASKIAPDKIINVVYENLVTDPKSETIKICQFLKIEWSSQMLYPERLKHLGEQAITSKSDKIWYDPKTYNRDPEAHPVDKWKNQLTSMQQATVAMSFKDDEDLIRIGYDFSINSLSKAYYFIFRLTCRAFARIRAMIHP
jgi:sulfotransferase family protein